MLLVLFGLVMVRREAMRSFYGRRQFLGLGLVPWSTRFGDVQKNRFVLNQITNLLVMSQKMGFGIWVLVFSNVPNSFTMNGGWKVHAKAARFERLMDEKYGMFRPFLKEHPEIEQFVRSVQRKYATGQYSPLRQGKPPIPKSTAVIVLIPLVED